MYVNDLAPHDDVLRIRCVGHASAERCKSDAFIITYNENVWLIDGGMRGNYDSLCRMLELRQAWLGNRRHDVDNENTSCALHGLRRIFTSIMFRRRWYISSKARILSSTRL